MLNVDFFAMTTKKQNTEFGLVVSLVILIISLWFKIDLYVFAVITLLVSLLFPKLYTPFTWLWFGLAEILERVMSKVLLFLIFFLVITPVGLIRRMFGKDNLHTGRSKNKNSLFENQIHTYTPEELERQF